jgi:hypothetical protein
MPLPICEAFRSIDVRELNRWGRLHSGQCFPLSWTRLGEPFGEVLVLSDQDSILLFAPSFRGSERRPLVQQVKVTWTPCHLGGQRPWFRCPLKSCGRRCAVIYLAGEHVACRRCLGLVYSSQQEPVRQRGLCKARKIRDRLGGSANMAVAFPDRPKGMHRTTYKRLHAAHDQAADRCMAGLSRFLNGD